MLQSNTRPAANSFPFAVLNQEEITALYHPTCSKMYVG